MKRWQIVFFILLVGGLEASGQLPGFTHFNTSSGLSDNHVECLVIDAGGNLWIGTTDGLNVYDGYGISVYRSDSRQGMISDTVRQLYCDRQERMWIVHRTSVEWMDQARRFHPVAFQDSARLSGPMYLFESDKLGMILCSSEQCLRLDQPARVWEPFPEAPMELPGQLKSVSKLGDNKAILIGDRGLIVFDFVSGDVVYRHMHPDIAAAYGISQDRIAVAWKNGKVNVIDIGMGVSLKTWNVGLETGDRNSSPRVTDLCMVKDGSLILTTILSGVFKINMRTDEIASFRHDPFDPYSLATDLTTRVIQGNDGELIIGTNTAGVSICDLQNKRAGYKTLFRDAYGEVFDGYVNEIAEDSKGMLWIAASDRLIRWDRARNRSQFYPLRFRDVRYGLHALEIRAVMVDRIDRVWVGAIGAGVALLDQETGQFVVVTDTAVCAASANTYPNDLIEWTDAEILVGTFDGLYAVSTRDLRTRSLEAHPGLGHISRTGIISLYRHSDNELWIGSSEEGVFRYNSSADSLGHFTVASGLISNTGYAITGDTSGNIYIADDSGFNIIAPDGSVSHYTRASGMPYHRVESILVDGDAIWLANNKCVVRYEPANRRFEYLKASSGITMDGFRYHAACRSADGTLFFGTQRGINFFRPDMLKSDARNLRVSIAQISVPDSAFRFSGTVSLKLRHNQNKVQFAMTAIDLMGSRNVAYQYRLTGLESEWQGGGEDRTARYTALPPGAYTFVARASADRVNWTDSENVVHLNVLPPFWRTWWFLLISGCCAIGIPYTLVWYRIRRIRHTEAEKTALHRQLAETEMRALRSQMNPHFIFNSLNSINKYILRNDHANASRYLTRFAKLIRLILDNSNQKEIALSDELEALRLYVEMESLRFANKFDYTIDVDDSVRADMLQVPPLIFQPYVENAIWHGLLHKETGGRLTIQCRLTAEHHLECVIRDNGVGRNYARQMKSKSVTTNKSLGMKLTEDRIGLLNRSTDLNARIQINDLYHPDGSPAGTQITLLIPI